jgi:hypothetical protein
VTHFSNQLAIKIDTQNEGERRRRSMLIYGNPNMGHKKDNMDNKKKIMKRVDD